MKAIAIFLCLLVFGAAQDYEIDEIIEFAASVGTSTDSSTATSLVTESSSTTEVAGSTSTSGGGGESSTATTSEVSGSTGSVTTGEPATTQTQGSTEPATTGTSGTSEPATTGTSGPSEAPTSPVTGKTQPSESTTDSSPAGSTAEPGSTLPPSTLKPTTAPLKFTTIKLGNGVTIYDQRAVLQEAVDLQAAVQNMTIEMNTLAGQLSANSSLGPQMLQMQANATALQSTLTSIINQMTSLSTNATDSSVTLAKINSKFSCMADSECVVPVEECKTAQSTVDTTPQSANINSTQTADAGCRIELGAAAGDSVIIDITTAFTRTGSLVVTTEDDKNVVQANVTTITKSGQSNLVVNMTENATKIVFTYIVAVTAQLNADISYYKDACVDFKCEGKDGNTTGTCSLNNYKPQCTCYTGYGGARCEKDDCLPEKQLCKNNGTCYFDPQYTPRCNCPSCHYGGDYCDQENVACTRAQGGNCNNNFGGAKCLLTDTDCQPFCTCDGKTTTTKPCNATSASNYGMFENAVPGDSIFQRFANWMN